jgi:hypothetical protein
MITTASAPVLEGGDGGSVEGWRVMVQSGKGLAGGDNEITACPKKRDDGGGGGL